MPANTTRDHHHHHHHPYHDIFNPNPNTNSNSNSNPQKPTPKLLSLLLKVTIMSLITTLFFLFLGIAATAAFLQFFFLHRRSSASYSYSPVNLPRQKYASGSASSVKEDCAVCLEAFRDDEWCRSLPKCRHLFHVGCVDRWLANVANCPVCRAPVKLDSGASGSVIGDDESKLSWAVAI